MRRGNRTRRGGMISSKLRLSTCNRSKTKLRISLTFARLLLHLKVKECIGNVMSRAEIVVDMKLTKESKCWKVSSLKSRVESWR